MLSKVNKFLESISRSISLQVRKSDIKDFSRLREIVKTIKNVYNATAVEQSNAVPANSNSDSDDFCAKLLKINSDQSAAISEK